MQNILIFGAGKSSIYLIEYLLHSAKSKDRMVTVADIRQEYAAEKIKGHPFGKAASINIHDQAERSKLISDSDLVISMLPPPFHPIIAQDCLQYGVHLLTASYESDDLRKLKNAIEEKNLFFLNECGLDPGIDHMSAMRIIEREQEAGHRILSFKSYCGGLMAPESESNPWKYKFTWNSRNVVLAGQGVAKFIEADQVKYIPYHQLFNRLERVHFEDLGEFEGYANRNSLAYRKTYGLDSIPTLLRGTLRRTGYCSAWNIFVQLGMTDDSYVMELPKMATKKDFLSAFLPSRPTSTPENGIRSILFDVSEESLSKLRWLGLFSDELLPVMEGSPAAVLQGILEEKWQLEKRDKDMIVMQHIFDVETEKGIKRITSSLSCVGENETHTAMAKTVGLPLAMAADLLLDGKITVRGLFIPVRKEIYEPILHALESEGIIFQENEKLVS